MKGGSRAALAAFSIVVASTACASVDAGGGLDAARGPSPSASPTGEPSPTSSATPTPVPSPSPTSRPEPSLAFVAMGDWGSGLPGQFDVAERLCGWRSTHRFDLVVTTGDNVYDSGDPSRFEDVFFEPYDCLFARGVRFRASLGNHDIVTDNGRPELEEPAFGMKARNYVVRKSGVRFVIADSNYLDIEWMRRALVGEPGDRWKIVVMHHPVYSSGSEHGSTPGFRPDLPRLFRRKGVDLVLNGHDHNYEVTKPLRGLRYVVTGGGGASIRACVSGRSFSDVCEPRYHFLWIRTNDSRINVKAIPANGRAFDEFTTTGLD